MKPEGTKRMVIGGILFFLVAPAIFVIALVIAAGSAADAINDGTKLSSGQSTHLDAGEEVWLLVDNGTTGSEDGATTGTGIDRPAVSCTATDPNGQPVQLTSSSGTEIAQDGQQFVKGYTMTATTAGNYTIDCQGRSVLVMDSDLASKIGTRVGGAVIGAFVIPFFVGVAGLVLFIWGLVARSRSKRRIQEAAYGQYGQQGYGQPAYGGQYNPPQQYGGQYGQQQGGYNQQQYPGYQQPEQPYQGYRPDAPQNGQSGQPPQDQPPSSPYRPQ